MTMSPGHLIAEARRQAGLTQEELAGRLGVAQPMISLYERGHRDPSIPTLRRLLAGAGADLVLDVTRAADADPGSAYRPMTLARLGDQLAATHDDASRRRLVLEFLEEYGWELPGDRVALVREEPPPTGDQRWDALLGAIAEHLTFHDDSPTPAWATSPSRFLDRAWFWIDLPAARTRALVHAPAPFRRRGVFLHRDDLGRA